MRKKSSESEHLSCIRHLERFLTFISTPRQPTRCVLAWRPLHAGGHWWCKTARGKKVCSRLESDSRKQAGNRCWNKSQTQPLGLWRGTALACAVINRILQAWTALEGVETHSRSQLSLVPLKFTISSRLSLRMLIPQLQLGFAWTHLERGRPSLTVSRRWMDLTQQLISRQVWYSISKLKFLADKSGATILWPKTTSPALEITRIKKIHNTHTEIHI